MPDDDQLSDLASVQILSHPHLAQIRSRSHHGHLNHSRRLASCRAPRHRRLSTPPSSRDGGVE
jgi:hypothetical protein